MPKRTVKNIITRCRECGATTLEAFLERIKGSNQYVCDECAQELAFPRNSMKYKGKSFPIYDDELPDDHLFI